MTMTTTTTGIDPMKLLWTALAVAGAIASLPVPSPAAPVAMPAAATQSGAIVNVQYGYDRYGRPYAAPAPRYRYDPYYDRYDRRRSGLDARERQITRELNRREAERAARYAPRYNPYYYPYGY